MVYIRSKNLEGLHRYKYAGVDHSLTSKYVLKPFYNNVAIKCFPMSMAPNAITLSGFGFVVINFLTLLWYNPTLDQDMPPWVAMHVMEVQRERKEDPIKPLYGLLPYFATWAFVPSYLYLQPVILEHHLIPFVFYVGLINAYSVGLMIIAHLTKTPKFPMHNVLTVPLSLAVLDSAGPLIGLWPSALRSGTYQIAFVFMCMGLSIGVYGSFVYDIITTICDYLDIWCLTIKHPYNEEDEKKKASSTSQDES
ncbi:hypothetical protein P7C71_g4700, partial [Lecanoromycetidae sp. Uapishka_2]